MTVHHADAIDFLATLDAGCAALILTDMPYNVTQNPWDEGAVDFERFWPEAWRVLRADGAVVTTAVQPFAARIIMSQPRAFRHEWIWRKSTPTGHMNANRAPLRAHESVLVFAREAPRYAPQMAASDAPVHPGKKGDGRDGVNYGASRARANSDRTLRYPTSVLEIKSLGPTSPERVGHPTQKPVALMRYFVETYSSPGDFVVDPYAGSGTTGVACREAGRRFEGAEIDGGWARVAAERALGLYQKDGR